MSRSTERTWLECGGNIAALVLVIVVNALANALPINGHTTAEVAAKYPSLFTPAGFTFAIWVLIYAALILYVAYQAAPAQRYDAVLARISGPFLLSSLANAAWILAWHFDRLVLSLGIILVLLFALLRIYRELGRADTRLSAGMRWFVRLPFSIYLAWIVVATIANASAVQTGFGWNDVYLTASSWTLAKLGLVATIAAWAALRLGDIAMVLVIGWAALGIQAANQAGAPVAGAAGMVAVIAALLAGAAAFERARPGD